MQGKRIAFLQPDFLANDFTLKRRKFLISYSLLFFCITNFPYFSIFFFFLFVILLTYMLSGSCASSAFRITFLTCPSFSNISLLYLTIPYFRNFSSTNNVSVILASPSLQIRFLNYPNCPHLPLIFSKFCFKFLT